MYSFGHVGPRDRDRLVGLHLLGQPARQLHRLHPRPEGTAEHAFDEAFQLRLDGCAGRPCGHAARRRRVGVDLRGGPNATRRDATQSISLRRASRCRGMADRVPTRPTGSSYSALEYGPSSASSAPRGALDLVLFARQATPRRSPRAARSRRRSTARRSWSAARSRLGGAVVVVDPARLRHQQLPGQPQGPRLPGLRLRRAGARATARAGPQRPPFEPPLEPSRRATRSTCRPRSTPSARTPSSSSSARESTDHPGRAERRATAGSSTALEFRADAIERIAAAAPDGARRQGQAGRRSTRSPARCRHSWQAT